MFIDKDYSTNYNDLVNTTRNEAKKFFGLSEEEKLKLRLDPKRKHLNNFIKFQKKIFLIKLCSYTQNLF